MKGQQDPRVTSDICGWTHIGPTGIEWICIKKPHGEVYRRNKSSRNHRRGDLIFSDNPSVDRHYCINRWPNREYDVGEEALRSG